MSEIKTALERFKAYCASKGIPEKSSLAHIHKIGQFEEHERKELRAAYEALQKENAELKEAIKKQSNAVNAFYAARSSEDKNRDGEIIRLRSLDEDNKGLKECNAILTDENAAQAKRIAEQLEDNLKQKDLILNFQTQYVKDHAEIEALRKHVESVKYFLLTCASPDCVFVANTLRDQANTLLDQISASKNGE